MKTPRALLMLSVATLLAGCAGTPQGPVSEVPLDDRQVLSLQPGITGEELQQRLGPPAMRSGYKRLDETVLSWRLIEPGNRRMFFNAHLDASGRVKYYSSSPDWAARGAPG
jgi:hypothetical protein